MTPQRWSHLKDVFFEARERDGEENRRAYLESACGDDQELRAEIELLLAKEQEPSLRRPAPDFLESIATQLPSGRMLAQYRLEAKLGQGGMGAVYRAYDTRLHRQVALKVLVPEHLADPASKRRLLQEARAASSLNHPNIVTIHEIGSDSGMDFLAMEWIEGQSLKEVIPARGLPLCNALDYAVQIAAGLAKAHDAGIVHRDLKPANIMVTADGHVKLLDFGLAHRVVTTHTDETASTIQGIAGTPPYMSPEQAQGHEVDARSDVFSFGTVLYEMLTGQRAFGASTAIAQLEAVLRAEPPPLAGMPAELAKLVSRCLRKDPARRAQHMDDVKLVLEELREPQSARRLWRRPAIALLLVAVVVTLGPALWRWRAREELPPMRVVPLTSYPGPTTGSSFSPDGNQYAFQWDGGINNFDIYVKQVGSAAPPLRLTTDPERDGEPSWSPDGRWIAFVHRRGTQDATIYLVSPLGGPERKVMDIRVPWTLQPAMPYAKCWFPDSKWLAVVEAAPEGGSGIFLVPVGQGEQRELYASRTKIPHSPAISPDGRFLAFASCTAAYLCDIELLELDGRHLPRGRSRPVTPEKMISWGLSWMPDSRSLIYGAGPGDMTYLWRTAISGSTKPERLELPGPGAHGPEVSGTAHRLAFTRYDTDRDIWALQPGRPPRVLISSTLQEFYPQLSPDGRRIAFTSDRSGATEVWVVDRDGSKPVQLTEGPGRLQGYARWSPDGRRLVFASQAEDGHWAVYAVDAAGGQPRRLTPPAFETLLPQWSRDGNSLYFVSDRTGRAEVWRMPAAGGQPVQITTEGGIDFAESWDGQALYYVRDRNMRSPPLFSRPLAGGPERRVLDAIITYAVTKDGIYFCAGSDKRGVYPLEFLPFGAAKSRVLARLDLRPEGLNVSADGQTLLFVASKSESWSEMMIENFR